MRLSSVMFFSFSSAMVMFTCEEGCCEGIWEGEVAPDKERTNRNTTGATQLAIVNESGGVSKHRGNPPSQSDGFSYTFVLLRSNDFLKDAVMLRGVSRSAGPQER